MPPKKRKREGPHARRPPPLPVQHWDDPGSNQDHLMYDENGVMQDSTTAAETQEEEEEEESRELTNEEIWDDSALIDAWNAANEEYEAMHGRGKKWKHERTHQSPLWYNVPPEKLSAKANGSFTNARQAKSQNADEANSKLQDFHSFIPSHDPSLMSFPSTSAPTIPAQTTTHIIENLTPNLTQMDQNNVSADEAFSQALNAMYWVGYWTATYNAQRRTEATAMNGNDNQTHESDDEDAGDDDDAEVDDVEEDLVSTQRS